MTSFLNREGREHPDRQIIEVESAIPSAEGSKSKIKVELGKDGMPRAAAFFDIDGTLAHLKFVHYAAIQEMYPDVDPEELTRVFEAGWHLGTSFREQYRMHGIYREGKIAWKDEEIFRREEFFPKQERIDSPGFPEHELSARLLEQYNEAAVRVVDKAYAENPGQFEQTKIRPVFRLAQLYKRLAIPMGVMTANPGGLTRAFAKHLAFSETFIDLATDENMVGGGKERAIEYLVGQMEAKGIPVPKDRLILVGDSIRGDVGVGRKLPEDWQAKFQGIVVIEDQEALGKIQELIQKDSELQRLVQETDVSGLLVDQVPVSKSGKPILSSKYRNRFLYKL